MTNQLQKITVDKVVEQYQRETGLPIEQAFLYLIIEKFLDSQNLNAIDIEESIVDGSDDCGIDAIVINEDSARPEVYFFQSKYHRVDNSFEKVFPGNEVEKVRAALEEFVLKGKINNKYQNSRLVDRLHSVKNLLPQNPKYILVFCSNGLPPATSAQIKLNEFLEECNSSGDFVSVEYIDLDRIASDLIAPEITKEIDFKLQTVGGYFYESNGDVKLFVGMVDGEQIAKLVEQYRDNLFEKNVRGFLKKHNPINKQIINSASGDQSPYFLYLNNGITITCQSNSHTPAKESPNLDIKSGQIVNGQQTARSIYQAYLEKKLNQDIKVMVRVLETSNKNILPKIIEATNSQTKVTSRDLHSNDEIQRLIEHALSAKGYYYEARKGKYQGKEKKYRIDADLAAQAYYAIYCESPARAKDKKRDLFGTLYDDIFNEDTRPEEILLSYKIIEKVRILNKDSLYEKFNFLKDATLHTAALIYRIAPEDMRSTICELDLFLELYRRTLEATNQVVQKRYADEKEKYEHRRTFKDPETYGRILEELMMA